jgi:hypothetical protein
MNNDNFFSIDRLVEFGLGVGVAQQMVNSMNHALQNTYIPGSMNQMAGNIPARSLGAFFVILDGKQAGPFSEDEMTRLILQGAVGKTTYVWRAGMPAWERCENVPEVLRLVALCPPPLPNGENRS